MNANSARSISGRDLKAFSAEITANSIRQLSAAADAMPLGMPIYIAALPRSTAKDLIDMAAEARAIGLDPIPHLVARNYQDESDFRTTLEQLQRRAKITKALVLGGDRDEPAGLFDSALQLIETGLLEEHGIRGISVGCYPEGHPRIDDAILRQALHDKLAAAKDHGLATRLITQICFDAPTILRFVEDLRADGIHAPLRVGVVGPIKLATLLKYAAACGVGPSLRALGERGNLGRKLLSGYTPEELLDTVSEAVSAQPELNIVGAHFFTFGSLKGSVGWMHDDPRLGLSFVEPPFFDWDNAPGDQG